MAYTTMNSIHTLAYSSQTSPHPFPLETVSVSLPVLRKEAEEAVCSLKANKKRGEATTIVLTD